MVASEAFTGHDIRISDIFHPDEKDDSQKCFIYPPITGLLPQSHENVYHSQIRRLVLRQAINARPLQAPPQIFYAWLLSDILLLMVSRLRPED